FVESLGIALFADFDGRIDEDFYEISFTHGGPHGVAITAIGADKRRQRDQAGIAEELGHGTNAADVFLAILGRKAQAKPLGKLFAVSLLEHAGAGVEAMADVVAI